MAEATSGDILIPSDKLQEFFFMDDDEEQKEFGHASSKLAAATLSANQIMKDKAKELANDMKKI
jgi:hypothetical protein